MRHRVFSSADLVAMSPEMIRDELRQSGFDDRNR